MPIKTSSGKWKWGNVERSSKKELVQTVYGIWKKNGSKGSFSDFLKGTHESIISEKSFKLYAYDIDTDKLYFHGTNLEVESFKSRPPTPDNIFYVAQDKKYAKKYGKNIYAIKLSENLKPLNISDEKCWKDIENNFPKFVYYFWVYGNSAYLDGFTKDGKLKAKKGKYSPVDLLSLAVRLYPTIDDYPYYSAIDWDGAVPEKFRKNLKKDYEDYKEWLKQNGFNSFNDKKIPKGNSELIRKILVKKLHEIGYNAYLGIEARGMTRSAILGLFDISAIDKIGLYDSKKKDIANESYEPPYTLDTIKQKYGDEVYRKLRDDPVHRFRAETGIEVIHKEPTLDEFERIVNNWNLMTLKQKKRSDEFSMKQFGKNNYDRIDNIRKSYMKKESVISEGKHWPEDYVKTAFNTIKNSELGKQSWYSDNYINQDLKTIVDEFSPLSHKNSNLGYFATIIKWFIQYAGKDKQKYQEFIERKLDGIIKTLLWLSNNSAEELKLKEQIKTKWTFEDFEKYQKKVEDQISREQSDKLKNTKLHDKGYEVILINSYEELHEKFGGDKTGYDGESEWCHTNGKSTYDSWTSNGKYNFFVLAKKDWEKIKPPDPSDETTKAYDEYGTSLIAILVDVASGKLLNATLRWNHVIEPGFEKEGASVDKAFLGWGDLAEVTGKDVEKEIKEKLKNKQEELRKEIEEVNRRVNEYLETHKGKIKELDPKTNFKIIQKFKDIVTKIKIPKGVTSIGGWTFDGCSRLISVTISDGVISIGNGVFYDCFELTSVTIPDSVTSIGDYAFSDCSGLTSITIPDSVTSIGDHAFEGCSKLKTIYCSEKIWNKFRYVFPESATRKDPPAKNESAEVEPEEALSVKESSEVDKFQEVLSKPTRFNGQQDEEAFTDVFYYSKEYRFAWKIIFDKFRHKTSIHVFKPDTINVAGEKRFGWREYRVSDDHKQMQEVDLASFPTKDAATQAFKKLLP